MLVTFTIDNENFSQLDVSQDLEVENFLALVALENPSISADSTDGTSIVIVVNGRQWKIDSDVLKMKLYVSWLIQSVYRKTHFKCLLHFCF